MAKNIKSASAAQNTNQSNAKKIRSYCDILDRAADLWDRAERGSISAKQVETTLNVGNFMLDTLKVAVQDRTSKLGGIM